MGNVFELYFFKYFKLNTKYSSIHSNNSWDLPRVFLNNTFSTKNIPIPHLYRYKREAIKALYKPLTSLSRFHMHKGNIKKEVSLMYIVRHKRGSPYVNICIKVLHTKKK